MNEILELEISRVKLQKAERLFEDGIAAYGSVESRLKSLDCKNREEAIKMLAIVQTVTVCKVDGEILVF